MHRIARTNDCSRSIERQRCPIFVVVHAREVILRIHAPCPAKKELIEGFHCLWSQRIDDTSESDLREVRLCSSNLNELELVREYPCPIRDEVTPGEGDVRAISRYVIAAELRDKLLVVVPIRGWDVRQTASLLRVREAVSTPAADRFQTFVRKWFGETAR